MSETATIELTVSQETAVALSDERRRAAVGRLVDMMVKPGENDVLSAVFAEAARQAAAGGLTEADVKAELEAYNAERRS